MLWPSRLYEPHQPTIIRACRFVIKMPSEKKKRIPLYPLIDLRRNQCGITLGIEKENETFKKIKENESRNLKTLCLYFVQF